MKSDMPTPDDKDIVQRVLDGDVNSFKVILNRYEHVVLNIVHKHIPFNDIEETVQEVFIRAFQSLGTFSGKSTLKPWLSAITVKTCYDYWRKRYKSHEVPMSMLSENHQEWLEKFMADQSAQLHDMESSKNEAQEILNWVLGTLSPEDRMVMELVYLEGLSGKETANLLGWSVANVKVRSFRIRQKLRKRIAKII